jgi:chloride channel 7
MATSTIVGKIGRKTSNVGVILGKATNATAGMVGKATNATAGIVGKAAKGTTGIVSSLGDATAAGLDKVGLGAITNFAGGVTKAGVSVKKLALVRGASTMKMFNSRAVGGAKPHPKLHSIYHEVESINYGDSDTKENENLILEHYKKIDEEPQKSCKQPRLNRGAYIWFLYLLIGTMVSVVVSLILTFTGFIEKTRDKYTQKFILEKGLGYGWLLWTGSSLLCTTLACMCVLVRPAAAASGIPGLLSLLNGTSPQGGKNIFGQPTRFDDLRTTVAKAIGMCFSIPSGLFVGPEGPIIHICAMVAKHTAQGVAWFEVNVYPKTRHEIDNSTIRDFLATGAGCGICSAFYAPLAGVLFVVEEASSFLTVGHIEKTFGACCMAYWVVWGMKADSTKGKDLVKFPSPPGDNCSIYRGDDTIWFFALGILGGILGAAFNQIVEEMNHFRVHHINPHMSRRYLEVVAVTLITGSVCVLLPSAFPCVKSTENLILTDSLGCLSDETLYQISEGELSEKYLYKLLKGDDFMSVYNNATHPQNSYYKQRDEAMLIPKLDKTSVKHTLVEKILAANASSPTITLSYPAQYTCKEGEINPMAMLFMKGGAYNVKNIFVRGAPHLYTPAVLITFFVFYFSVAAMTSGISVPAGLVVPMMLIGGTYGRLAGLVNMEWKRNFCPAYAALGTVPGHITPSYWARGEYPDALRSCGWPDPGAWAVVGAASFMGGSGRITLFLAVVMMEVTHDLKLLGPIAMVVLIAMWVGNMINHGLYHALIPLSGVPFLNNDPDPVMHMLEIKHVMAHPVISLTRKTSIDGVMQCMKGNKHQAFPVLDKDNTVIGLVTRTALLRALSTKDEQDASVDFGNRSLHKKDAEIIASRLIQVWWRKLKLRKQMGNANEGNLRASSAGQHAAHTWHMHQKNALNISDIMDRAPIVVTPDTKIHRSFKLFRMMGLRHLLVVNRNGTIAGMITRKDLQSYKVNEAIAEIAESKGLDTSKLGHGHHGGGHGGGHGHDHGHDHGKKHEHENLHQEVEMVAHTEEKPDSCEEAV